MAHLTYSYESGKSTYDDECKILLKAAKYLGFKGTIIDVQVDDRYSSKFPIIESPHKLIRLMVFNHVVLPSQYKHKDNSQLIILAKVYQKLMEMFNRKL